MKPHSPKPKYRIGTLFSCVPRIIPSDKFSFALIIRRQLLEIKGGDWSFGPQWYYDLILFNEEVQRVVEVDLDELIKCGIMEVISEGPDELQEATKKKNKRNTASNQSWKD
tara:strand:+ start:77 stop:409 length:333 start_codon:yes stop_codon:yes gene_type:complete